MIAQRRVVIEIRVPNLGVTNQFVSDPKLKYLNKLKQQNYLIIYLNLEWRVLFYNMY